MAPLVVIRRARPDDGWAADLIYHSAWAEFTRLAGSMALARDLLGRLWPVAGHSLSFDAGWVAEDIDGRAGVVVAFPARQRLLRHLRLGLRAIRWLPLSRSLLLPVSLVQLSMNTPAPPLTSVYVMALAVAADHRRRGVAFALGRAVESYAREAGFAQLSAHTGSHNLPARQGLARFGFTGVAQRLVGGEGYVLYVKDV